MANKPVLCYRIQQGVRRCVAVRNAGWTDVPARIVEDGRPDVFTRLPLSVIASGKASIPRDSRYIVDTEYKTAVLGTQPPPIEVNPVYSQRVAARLTPVALVALT